MSLDLALHLAYKKGCGMRLLFMEWNRKELKEKKILSEEKKRKGRDRVVLRGEAWVL